jgi:uncharacterized protein (DUF433 family)
MAAEARTEAELIAQYVEPSPYQPGRAEARIVGYGVPVWALISHYRAVGMSAQQVASDYELPLGAVEAALAYYELHRAVIDARLEANAV